MYLYSNTTMTKTKDLTIIWQTFISFCEFRLAYLPLCVLTRCQLMHICVSRYVIIGSDNVLLPVWGQTIIWTNAGLLYLLSVWHFALKFCLKYNHFTQNELENIVCKMVAVLTPPECIKCYVSWKNIARNVLFELFLNFVYLVLV